MLHLILCDTEVRLIEIGISGYRDESGRAGEWGCLQIGLIDCDDIACGAQRYPGERASASCLLSIRCAERIVDASGLVDSCERIGSVGDGFVIVLIAAVHGRRRSPIEEIGSGEGRVIDLPAQSEDSGCEIGYVPEIRGGDRLLPLIQHIGVDFRVCEVSGAIVG